MSAALSTIAAAGREPHGRLERPETPGRVGALVFSRSVRRGLTRLRTMRFSSLAAGLSAAYGAVSEGPSEALTTE